MNSIELARALDVPAALASLERPFTIITGKDRGATDWTRMRDTLGDDRWRGYIRLRQVARDAARAA